MSFINFHLSVILPPPDVSTGLNTPPEELMLDFGTGAHAAPEEAMPAENALGNGEETETTDSSNRRESFNYNRANGELPLEWLNFDAFQAWHWNEELAHY